MKHTTFLLLALIAPLTLIAQTSTAPAPTAGTGHANERSLDDDPGFKSLSPEMQEKTRRFMDDLNKAIAAEKQGAQSDPGYTYRPAPKTVPCEVAPKKPSLAERMKERAKRAIDRQAAKGDARVGTATNGKVDVGIQDSAHTAINEADQPKPCPAKQSK